MDVLPPELLLYVVSFLPLTSLIAARGVNTRWRYFAQGAPLHPARRTLLDLYLVAIDHPNFPSLVGTLRPHIREFDREAYIADLTSRGCVLPHLFELWVLEWPSKAVHFWAWPGLAMGASIEHEYYYAGEDLLGYTTPIIDTIPVPRKLAEHIEKPTCTTLGIFKVYFDSCFGEAVLWMVVDPDEKINDRLAGRLFWTYSYYHFADGVNNPDPHRIFYNTPFGSSTNFKLGDFLAMLDTSERQVDDLVALYYSPRNLLTDDSALQ